MLVAGWSFTSMCNLKCRHCYNASGTRKNDELTLEQAKQVAGKLKKAGVEAVNFGGGECCLRKDFIPLCKYLNRLGIKISYTTNGTTFGIIEPYLRLFHDIGVSIDFADAKRHDEFRGEKGTFNKAVKTIKELVKAGVDTEIVTCITKLNCQIQELEKIWKLANSLNVNYWRLNRFRANGRGIGNKSSLALSKKDLKKAYEFLSTKMQGDISVPEPLFRAAFGGRYFLDGDPSGFTAFRIQPNGEVSPSVFLKESGGNILKKSVEEIMDSDVFRKIRNRTPRGKCRQCLSYSHCRGGDAGASYLEYGHFNGPDPLCWMKKGEQRPAVIKSMPKIWNVHELYLCTVYVPVGESHDA